MAVGAGAGFPGRLPGHGAVHRRARRRRPRRPAADRHRRAGRLPALQGHPLPATSAPGAGTTVSAMSDSVAGPEPGWPRRATARVFLYRGGRWGPDRSMGWEELAPVRLCRSGRPAETARCEAESVGADSGAAMVVADHRLYRLRLPGVPVPSRALPTACSPTLLSRKSRPSRQGQTQCGSYRTSQTVRGLWNPARWCCRGQVLDVSKVSIVQRAAPLRSILASLVISGTPKLSARAT